MSVARIVADADDADADMPMLLAWLRGAGGRSRAASRSPALGGPDHSTRMVFPESVGHIGCDRRTGLKKISHDKQSRKMSRSMPKD